MVDLHQTESGLPPEHPWLALSRWGIVWRAALGAIVAGLCVLLVITLLIGTTMPEITLNLVWFGVPQLLVMIATAAVLGPWLREFHPFLQSLMFSSIALAAVFALVILVEVVSRVIGPSPWGAGLFMVLCFASLPYFLTGAIGYGLAIWSVTPRGRRAFWPLLVGVLLLFVGSWLVAQLAAG